MKFLVTVLVIISPLFTSAQELLLKISNPQVSGNQVTHDVSADNFIDMVATQYVILYDTSMMTFDTIQNAVLPGWNDLSFYESEPGRITILWLSFGIEGVTLANGTVMYQLLFDMKNGSFGNVCFSEDPRDTELVNLDGALSSFSIVDDCHAEPFQIILDPSGTKELARAFGLDVNSMVHSGEILFSSRQDREIAFMLFDMNGKEMTSFSLKNYSAGQHALKLQSLLVSGYYLLVAQMGDQKMAFKIVSQ